MRRYAPNTPTYIYVLKGEHVFEQRPDIILYVGQTTRPRHRARDHRGAHLNLMLPLLSRHVVVRRAEGYIVGFVVIEECSFAVARHRELVWIAHYLDAGHLLANRGPWNLKDPLYLEMLRQP